MVDNYFITWMNAFELLYNQGRAGALAIQDLDVEGVLATFLRDQAWVRDSWARNKGFWPGSIQTMVEKALKQPQN